MFVFPRFRSFRLAAALAALLLPATGLAQISPEDNYQVYRISEPFRTVGANATELLPLIGSFDGDTATIQLPFPFRFFGNVYDELNVGHKGYVVFGGFGTAGGIVNQTLPDANTPNNLIAVWWDDGECQTAGSYIRSEVRGTSPNREFVIEWNCHLFFEDFAFWNAQLRLLEGSSTIFASYGTLAAGGFSATMGIENSTASVAWNGATASGTTCGAVCAGTHWESDSTIIYSQGPDVGVSVVSTPSLGYSGLEFPVEAQAINLGGEVAEQVGVRFWVSRNATLEPDFDVPLGHAPEVADLSAGQSATFTLLAKLPEDLSPGPHYILAEGDPDNLVDEGAETNNVGASQPFQVEAPAADLYVEGLVAPSEATIGEPFPISFDLVNGGNLLAHSVLWAVVLSPDDIATSADLRIATGRATLEPISASRVEVEIELPVELTPNAYRIAVILDPDVEVPEIDEFNNVALADTAILVHGRELVITTTELAPATIGTDWKALLTASGGEAEKRWSLVGGELPPGISLEEEIAGGRVVATALKGRAGRLGSWDFTLQVESAGAAATQDYTLAVTADGTKLTVATRILPDGWLGEPFIGALAAVGGRLPYQWKIVSGSLPAGVVLRTDGEFFGAPEINGNFPFAVEVMDAMGATARAPLELIVRAGSEIRCLTRTLPTRMLDQSFDEALLAAGGTPPYSWTTLESMLLGDSAGPGETSVGEPPAGLTLSADGRVAGTPAKAGRYLWQVEVKGAEGGTGDRCSIVFDVQYDGGPTIVTRRVATVYVGAPYEVDLAAIGGEAPFAWTLGADSELPAGMELTPGGTLRGVVEMGELQGEERRTWDLTVHARDARNRVASIALPLTVQAERQVWEEQEIGEPRVIGGCQAGGGAGLLGLLALLAWRAPRRRFGPDAEG